MVTNVYKNKLYKFKCNTYSYFCMWHNHYMYTFYVHYVKKWNKCRLYMWYFIKAKLTWYISWFYIIAGNKNFYNTVVHHHFRKSLSIYFVLGDCQMHATYLTDAFKLLVRCFMLLVKKVLANCLVLGRCLTVACQAAQSIWQASTKHFKRSTKQIKSTWWKLWYTMYICIPFQFKTRPFSS